MSAPSGELRPTIYIGTFIHSASLKSLSILHDYAIGVDSTGEITFVHHPVTEDETHTSIASLYGFPSNHEVVQAPKTTANNSKPKRLTTFFFPGFIDTHTHAPQYPNVGLFGSSTLLDWLNTYTFPLESSFSSLPRARTVYTTVVRRALAHGTTCAAYYATTHVPATNLLVDICLAAGQRALIGRVCMDRLSPPDYRDASPATALADTKACIAHCSKVDPSAALIRPVITPRFAPSCSAQALAALGALHAATGHYVQTHISENTAEVALVGELFPDAESYAAVYDTAGLLSPRTILAHAVHLTQAELALVKDRGSGIAHCPVSNTALTSGAAPVREMMELGVPVGLGTDMSGGYSASVLEMVRQTLLVSRHVAMARGDRWRLSVEEALWLGTRGGAAVVGLGEQVGAFEVGKQWDAQMVCLAHVDDVEEVGEGGEGDDGIGAVVEDSGPVDIFGWETWLDRVAKWVYTGDDRNVAAVWVKGRLVHKRASVDI